MRHAPVALLLLGLAACSFTPPRRQGPPFPEVFPDASELVTTSDPAGLRERLATVPLPATEEHHAQLRFLLDSQATIDVPHLLLLVEAVHLPEASGNYYHVNGQRRFHGPRGRGRFAPVVDQLLEDALPKLVGVDRQGLGELLGRSQSDATLNRLAERLLPALDDGSTAALEQVIGGMAGSPAVAPFLVDHLAPRGLLLPDRGFDLLPRLPFDDQRVLLVRAMANAATSIEPKRLADAVAAMTFDDNRTAVLEAAIGRCQPFDWRVAERILDCFTFDDGRAAACHAFARTDTLRLDGSGLVRMVHHFTFDDDRVTCVRVLVPCLQGDLSITNACQLLAAFTFDDSRLAALQAARARLAPTSSTQQEQLLAAFTFDSSREQVVAMLRR